MAYGDRERPSAAEQVARAAGERAAWKLVAWIGGGTVALVVLFVVIFAAIAIYLGGGMQGLNPLSAYRVGTPKSRATLWLQDPAIVHSSLPNVVILAVMEHESRGQVFARNYNCTFGLTSPKECAQTYVGGIIHTESEDAGLMQINSGGWPQTPKWQALGLAKNPFNPQKNIAIGVAELEADMAKYHYLKYALEAYNSGSGGPKSSDAGYAQAVLANIQAYEAGPTLAVLSPQPLSVTPSTDPAVKGQITTYVDNGQYGSYWIVAEAAGPYGAAYSIPWAPQPPKCVKGGGKTTCTPQAPVLLSGRALVPPSQVVARMPGPPIKGVPCTDQTGCMADFPISSPGAPVWPGAEAWTHQQTDQSEWGITADWPGHRAGPVYVGFVPRP